MKLPVWVTRVYKLRNETISDLKTTTIAYICFGLFLAALALLFAGELSLDYFYPAIEILHSAMASTFAADAMVVESNFQSAVQFFRLAVLSAAFVAAFKSGYISLGLEGAIIVAVATVVLITSIGASSVWSGWLVIASLITIALIALLFFPLMHQNFERGLDDVTPGILLNIVSVTIAAAFLTGAGLLASEKQTIISVRFADFVEGQSLQTKAIYAFCLFWTCVAFLTSSWYIFRKTNLGLAVKALGDNRNASRVVGLSYPKIALFLALYTAIAATLVALMEFSSTGNFDIEVLLNRIIDVIAVALIARLNFTGIILGVLVILGISDFGLFVAAHPDLNWDVELTWALKGAIIIGCAFVLPLRDDEGNR